MRFAATAVFITTCVLTGAADAQQKCPKCSKEVSDGAFCPADGARLEPVKQKHCPKCKRSYPASARFCKKDGATLSSERPRDWSHVKNGQRYRFVSQVKLGPKTTSRAEVVWTIVEVSQETVVYEEAITVNGRTTSRRKTFSKQPPAKTGETAGKPLGRESVKIGAHVFPCEILRQETKPGDWNKTWHTHRFPFMIRSVTAKARFELTSIDEPKPKYVPVHQAATNLRAEVRGDTVQVRWRMSAEDRFVLISGYEVERRVHPKGTWKRVGEVSGEITRFEDATAAGGTTYAYRVVSRAEIDAHNPVVRHRDLRLPADQARRVSEVVTVATRREFYIVPVMTRVGTSDRVNVRVYRLHTRTGRFVYHTFRGIRIGQKIGKVVNKRVSKRRERVDFSTGATLLAAGDRKQKVERAGAEYEIVVQFIRIRWADGREEEVTNRDLPKELRNR